MPKAKAAPLSAKLLPVEKGAAKPSPAPGKHAETPDERVSMTFRIRRADHDHLRRLAFETRQSQQAFVDQALALLRKHGSTAARQHDSEAA